MVRQKFVFLTLISKIFSLKGKLKNHLVSREFNDKSFKVGVGF